ncbi:MAG: tripartite tricarboxylate transporter TctB family protein [Bacillota bacterium]|nr:tripartite tricarboxylate transporter TctB family protein [Bacillota bacterium]
MKKLVNDGSFIFTVLLLLFTVIIIILASGYKLEARLFPLVISIITFIISIVVIIYKVHPKLQKMAIASEESVDIRKVMVLILYIFGLFIMIFLFGFWLTTPVFVFLFLILYGREKWIKSIIISSAVTLLLYVGFTILIKVNMFKGFLFGARIPPL